jgi:tetratricopeptide (TPR) repeat protein
LRYEPDHAGALAYLKDKFSPASSTAYRVVPGDSLKEIASKVYLDPSKAFLIAYFNDLPPTAVPQPGTTLLIPRLKGMAVAVTRKESAQKAPEAPPEKGKVEPPPAAAGPETPAETTATEDSADAVLAGYGEGGMDEMVLTIYEEQEDEILQALRQAKSLMGKRDYDSVIPLARLILEKDPANEDAADLVNAAFYQKGADMDRQRKFLESLEMYEEVEPGYRDVDTRIAGVRQAMKTQAEQLYRQGVNYYVNENLAGAIDSWEKTLALDPDHAKAGQDIEKARMLLKKLQAIQ